MRVSCSAARSPYEDQLIERIKILGLKPIVTPILVRAVYEGADRALGEKLIDLFEHEPEHDIYVDANSI